MVTALDASDRHRDPAAHRARGLLKISKRPLNVGRPTVMWRRIDQAAARLGQNVGRLGCGDNDYRITTSNPSISLKI